MPFDTPLDDAALARLYTDARTHGTWLDRPVSDAQLRQLYELTRWGPTAMNISPLRIRYIQSPEARARLLPLMAEGNRAKTGLAPAVAILARDVDYHLHMPTLAPHRQGLLEQLAKVDPITAARLMPNDAQRIERALEIWQLTGRPMSALLEEEIRVCFPYRLIKLALMPSDRAVLHARIAERFDTMLRDGLLEELSRLRREYPGLSLDMPSMRCVGYRQAWLHQERAFDVAALREKGIAATRQLAKRHGVLDLVLRHLFAAREIGARGPQPQDRHQGAST